MCAPKTDEEMRIDERIRTREVELRLLQEIAADAMTASLAATATLYAVLQDATEMATVLDRVTGD